MKTKFNNFKEETIEYDGKNYIITDQLPEQGDMYINYTQYKRGLMFKDQMPLLFGTVMEMDDELIYAEEFKSDILSNCRKIIINNENI